MLDSNSGDGAWCVVCGLCWFCGECVRDNTLLFIFYFLSTFHYATPWPSG